MIYLDSHSSTQLDSRVLEAMMPFLTDNYANPSSSHVFGCYAREAVEWGRGIVANYLNAQPNQIFFTSGASESNNTYIKGVYTSTRQQYKHELNIITGPIEHPSVSETVNYLCQNDPLCFEHQLLVDQYGALSDITMPQTCQTVLCSVQAANNEIGTINDLSLLGNLCNNNGIFFHTDATQAIGKVPIDVQAQHIDALSFSAHKIHGPKGVGVLYVRRPELLEPLIHGGLQDSIRSGTLNVAGIVGLGTAIQLLPEVDWGQVRQLRKLLFTLLKQGVPGITLNGLPLYRQDRLPNNLNISIPGFKSEVFVKGMSDIFVSSGSACKSGDDKPSETLLTIGAQNPDCALRFGLSRFTTEEEIRTAAQRIVTITQESTI
jgi:cysteine desulfurase